VIGLLLLLLLGGAAFAAAVRLGVPRRLRSLIGAALLLGASGYAWQGRPGLQSSDARADAMPVTVEPALVDLRGRMMGRFTADASYFTISDALLRAGDRDAAAKVMLAGTKALPGSYMLWTGLGQNLAIHDGDQVSPAALLAFRQAIRLAPTHPAPYFSLGLAYVRAGDIPNARTMWRRAVALTPPGAGYRRDLEVLLAIIGRVPERTAR
jgi:Flp pilus assembly protein TadD